MDDGRELTFYQLPQKLIHPDNLQGNNEAGDLGKMQQMISMVNKIVKKQLPGHR